MVPLNMLHLITSKRLRSEHPPDTPVRKANPKLGMYYHVTSGSRNRLSPSRAACKNIIPCFCFACTDYLINGEIQFRHRICSSRTLPHAPFKSFRFGPCHLLWFPPASMPFLSPGIYALQHPSITFFGQSAFLWLGNMNSTSSYPSQGPSIARCIRGEANNGTEEALPCWILIQLNDSSTLARSRSARMTEILLFYV
jgi:hypothetical protein